MTAKMTLVIGSITFSSSAVHSAQVRTTHTHAFKANDGLPATPSNSDSSTSMLRYQILYFRHPSWNYLQVHGCKRCNHVHDTVTGVINGTWIRRHIKLCNSIHDAPKCVIRSSLPKLSFRYWNLQRYWFSGSQRRLRQVDSTDNKLRMMPWRCIWRNHGRNCNLDIQILESDSMIQKFGIQQTHFWTKNDQINISFCFFFNLSTSKDRTKLEKARAAKQQQKRMDFYAEFAMGSRCSSKPKWTSLDPKPTPLAAHLDPKDRAEWLMYHSFRQPNDSVRHQE